MGVAHFGYVPDKAITGYSKVKKALNYLSRQPQLNERLLVSALDALESSLKPKGCALLLHSIHACLACKSNAPSQEVVTVQGFRGVCKEEPFRKDFLMNAHKRSPLFTG
jgi:GTP cyclohydrolase I